MAEPKQKLSRPRHAGMWKPGQSGNPAGRPARRREKFAKQLAKQLTHTDEHGETIDELVEAVRDGVRKGDSGIIRIACEYRYGKPARNDSPSALLAAMGPEERRSLAMTLLLGLTDEDLRSEVLRRFPHYSDGLDKVAVQVQPAVGPQKRDRGDDGMGDS